MRPENCLAFHVVSARKLAKKSTLAREKQKVMSASEEGKGKLKNLFCFGLCDETMTDKVMHCNRKDGSMEWLRVSRRETTRLTSWNFTSRLPTLHQAVPSNGSSYRSVFSLRKVSVYLRYHTLMHFTVYINTGLTLLLVWLYFHSSRSYDKKKREFLLDTDEKHFDH